MIDIGIVTGLGDTSSQYFIDHLRNLSPSSHIHSIKASPFHVIKFLHNKTALYTYLDALIERLKIPESLIAIPCNSVHIISDRLQHKHIRFVPIHHVVADAIREKNDVRKVLILGTSTTIYSSIYQKLLGTHDCRCILPTEDEQAWVDSLIFDKLLHNHFNAEDFEKLTSIQKAYLDSCVADHVILACTDLCYLNQKYGKVMSCQTDSLDALVNAVIKKVERLKNAS
jgi:aspartate/glutamate racemase